MEENRQDKDLKQAELNTEAEGTTSRVTRHTWIGDKDEVRPDGTARPVTRSTIADTDMRGTKMIKTKIVERPKKPYRGFITDEEISQAEAAAEIDRRALAESRAAREEIAQTRIYSGFGEPEKAEDKPEEEPQKPKVRRKRTVNIQIADNKKFRRLVVLLAVFVVLLAFELSFAVMKARTATLPGSTAKLRSKTETVQANNTAIQESIDKIGDYDEVKANRDSWQKIRDQLAE
jgi:cell division protein FtsL